MLHLHTLWFIILAILWVGFFVLEGFDFGVGILHSVVGKTDTERRVAINTIGPWWDGNEVWLIVAGAGTFAAFPGWYATMFSALYLPLVLVLVALIVRGVAFEFKGRSEDPRWRTTWTWCMTIGSLMIPLLIGVGLGDLLAGIPVNSAHNYTGNFLDLLTPYGLWTGLTLVVLCMLHGATFLAMRTTDAVRERSRAMSGPLSWIAAAMVIGFVIWTLAVSGHTDIPGPVPVLAIIAVLATAWLASTADSEGWAFTASAVTIAAVVGSLFIELYPNVLISSTSALYNLTVSNAASGAYALKVMTIVTVLLFPIVLIYQGWSFWVFRGRVMAPPPASGQDTAAPSAPPMPAA
jgi:cytochrome d ubiquinol oxidase subunit II